MTSRPASVDPQGGPMTGNGGGPMPLAKPAGTWSHLAGKRHLTAREREVERLVVQGLTNREIAEMLFLGVRTVESHVAKIFTKLGIHSRRQLAPDPENDHPRGDTRLVEQSE